MLRIRTDESDLNSCAVEPMATDPASRVAARLRRSGYPLLRNVSCEFSQGLLTLSGMVPTFHLTQLAQELAAHTPGVCRVKNDLWVTGSTGRATGKPQQVQLVARYARPTRNARRPTILSANRNVAV